VDIENGYLRVMRKGSKEGFVPIVLKLSRVLIKYRLKYRPQAVGTDAFWLSEDGGPLSLNRVEAQISRYGKKAGLELRHTGSVLFLRNGGDPFTLQKMLGHTTLQMTRHYCNLADADVKAQHMKFGVATG
jgi:integrase/recombinase XerD